METSTTVTHRTDDDQRALWNGSAGQGRSVGVGIPDPMIAAARARAERKGTPAEFIRAAFDPYVHGADIRFTAACWMVEATNV